MTDKSSGREESLLRRFLEKKYREGKFDEFISQTQLVARQEALKQAAEDIRAKPPKVGSARERLRAALMESAIKDQARKEALAAERKRRASVARKVLDYLEQAFHNPLNYQNTPVSVRILAQDLDEESRLIARVCHSLAEAGIIQEISAGSGFGFYRIYGK